MNWVHFVQFGLKINQYIQVILSLDTIVNMALLTMSWTGYINVHVLDKRTLISCSLYLLPILAAYIASFLFPAATAVIRYL